MTSSRVTVTFGARGVLDGTASLKIENLLLVIEQAAGAPFFNKK
jgi:hypothetical protein